jgi:hypothetical protein
MRTTLSTAVAGTDAALDRVRVVALLGMGDNPL